MFKQFKKPFTSKEKKDKADKVQTDQGSVTSERSNKGGKKTQPSEQKVQKNQQGKPKGKNPKAQGSQSAVRTSDNSGLNNKKRDPFIQFGPVVNEFLASKQLVEKKVYVLYDKDLDKSKIALSFREVLPNGVTIGPTRQLPIEQYLVEKNALLKKKDPASYFKSFVVTCLDRLGLDLSNAKPDVDFKSVERFVMKHLSPLEREIVRLSDEDYGRIDTSKIPMMLKPTNEVIKDHYGSFTERTKFLISQINSAEPSADKEPPNWVLKGVPGMSKGVLLESLKIVPKSTITDEQQKLIDALGDRLFANLDEEEEEEINTSTFPVKPNLPPNASDGTSIDTGKGEL